MAIEAVRETVKPGQTLSGFYIKEATFVNPIIIKADAPSEVMTHLRPPRRAYEKVSERSEVKIFARQDDSWRECFKAVIYVRYAETQAEDIDGGREDRERANAYGQAFECAVKSCDKRVDKVKFYKWRHEMGIKYGEGFQLCEDVLPHGVQDLRSN